MEELKPLNFFINNTGVSLLKLTYVICILNEITFKTCTAIIYIDSLFDLKYQLLPIAKIILFKRLLLKQCSFVFQGLCCECLPASSFYSKDCFSNNAHSSFKSSFSFFLQTVANSFFLFSRLILKQCLFVYQGLIWDRLPTASFYLHDCFKKNVYQPTKVFFECLPASSFYSKDCFSSNVHSSTKAFLRTIASSFFLFTRLFLKQFLFINQGLRCEHLPARRRQKKNLVDSLWSRMRST